MPRREAGFDPSRSLTQAYLGTRFPAFRSVLGALSRRIEAGSVVIGVNLLLRGVSPIFFCNSKIVCDDDNLCDVRRRLNPKLIGVQSK